MRNTSLVKPHWLKVKVNANDLFNETKQVLNIGNIRTICSESLCPNKSTCFGHGHAAFLIMGNICTRKCPFCNVPHGRPLPLDPAEPNRLAQAVKQLGLKHVVVTSVDRDDLKDAGAGHFAACISKLREATDAAVEILVPDFKNKAEEALEILRQTPPDIFNHNIETVRRLYKQIKPGANYAGSLALLQRWKELFPESVTKSGLMVGLGERDEEVMETIKDLKRAGIDILTIGQYLPPSKSHVPVDRYVTPEIFEAYKKFALEQGIKSCFSSPLIRSSFLAENQLFSKV